MIFQIYIFHSVSYSLRASFFLVNLIFLLKILTVKIFCFSEIGIFQFFLKILTFNRFWLFKNKDFSIISTLWNFVFLKFRLFKIWTSLDCNVLYLNYTIYIYYPPLKKFFLWGIIIWAPSVYPAVRPRFVRPDEYLQHQWIFFFNILHMH